MRETEDSVVKKILLYMGLFLAPAGYALDSPTVGETPRIYISEIAAFESTEREWIEIGNLGSSPIDLTRIIFFENDTNHAIEGFRGESLLQPNTTAIVASKADQFAAAYPLYTGQIFDSSWSTLKEEGERIGLKTEAEIVIEEFTYPKAEKTSLERTSLLNSDALSSWRSHATSHSIGESSLAQNSNTVATLPQSLGTSTASQAATAAQNAAPTTPEPNLSASPQVQPLLPSEPAPPLSPLPQSPPPSAPPQPPPVPQAPPRPFEQKGNLPPHASIAVQRGSLVAQEKVVINFDGTQSSDPEGRAVQYYWDFGDGSIATSSNPPQHTYAQPGTYVVRLSVIDDGGLSDTQKTVVQVLDSPIRSQPESVTPQSQIPCEVKIKSAAGPNDPKGQKADTKLEPSEVHIRLTIETPEISGQMLVADAASANAIVSKKQNEATRTIRINELLPKPEEGPAAEWIELLNVGNKPVSLGKWILGDKSKRRYRLPETLVLEPREFLLIQRKESKIALNDDGDTLFLGDSGGNVIDTVSYSAAPKGKSYAFSDLWQWVDTPTPGKPNPTFQVIQGVVTANTGDGSLLLEDSGKTIALAYEAAGIDPQLSAVAFPEGTEIAGRAEKKSEDRYELSTLISQKLPEKPLIISAQERRITWYVIAILATSVLLNAVPLIREGIAWVRKKRPTETSALT